MKILKTAFLAFFFLAILFANEPHGHILAQNQVAPTITGLTPARTVQTSTEDITITNSCIESGKEKIYCLCVTKIFKNEMTLDQYRAAASIYGQESHITPNLQHNSDSETDIRAIEARIKDLSNEKMFRERCNRAEIYFASATES